MKLIDASMFLKVAHSIKELDDALDPITEELIEQIIEEQPEIDRVNDHASKLGHDYNQVHD